MSYPINYPTPQGANVQIFQNPNSTTDWVKPQGASFVWFTLIGAGGGGDDTGGGGSGAVTNCLIPAFLIPDVLSVFVGLAQTANSSSTVSYRTKGTSYTLLTGSGALGTSPGGATASNFFSAAGFYQSIAGVGTGSTTPPSTTFLSGGVFGNSTGVTANYGYSTPTNGEGYSQMQPIIVGVGNATGSNSRQAGFGYGGNGSTAGLGSSGAAGNGLVVIISW